MIDISRHKQIFNASTFDKRVDIVGVGAVGSKVALEVAKLGVKNLHIWDDDVVEAHNISNQAFYKERDIGKRKVVALSEHIQQATGLIPTVHDTKVDANTELGEVVFLLVDNMAARKEIFDGLSYTMTTEVIIEIRMGTRSGYIYTIDPNDVEQIEFWQTNWYPDKEVIQPSACGSKLSIGATSSIISGYAVWTFMDWFQVELSKQTLLPCDVTIKEERLIYI
ncbi:MAG: ThiF family adenylyltransferase [Candidatus Peribacteria bacterium]|jgi:molybdopterin/thiamine biosynthesis adenylyltransferase|nr:ThiF family adenylyltransferase [Candidatus Peribacteria bacterium]